jgi:hypothetical protein
MRDTRRKKVLARVTRLRRSDDQPRERALAARVTALEAAVEESRQLSQRLADVVDVVTELLVPAMDRDDERLRAALANLNKTLDDNNNADPPSE